MLALHDHRFIASGITPRQPAMIPPSMVSARQPNHTMLARRVGRMSRESVEALSTGTPSRNALARTLMMHFAEIDLEIDDERRTVGHWVPYELPG